MSATILTDAQQMRAATVAREIGAALRNARIDHGLTLEQLGDALDMWPSTISSIEGGYQENAELGNLVRLLDHFGLALVVFPVPDKSEDH